MKHAQKSYGVPPWAQRVVETLSRLHGKKLRARFRTDSAASSFGTPREFVEATLRSMPTILLRQPDKARRVLVWAVETYLRGGIRSFEDMNGPESRLTATLSVWACPKKRSALDIPGDIRVFRCLVDLERATILGGERIGVPSKLLEKARRDPQIAAATDVLVDTAEWLVVRVGNWKAAKFWGSETHWCTAPSRSFCLRYLHTGPLVVWINRRTGRKYQLHSSTATFATSWDRELLPKQVRTRFLPVARAAGNPDLLRELSRFLLAHDRDPPPAELADALRTDPRFVALWERLDCVVGVAALEGAVRILLLSGELVRAVKAAARVFMRRNLYTRQLRFLRALHRIVRLPVVPDPVKREILEVACAFRSRGLVAGHAFREVSATTLRLAVRVLDGPALLTYIRAHAEAVSASRTPWVLDVVRRVSPASDLPARMLATDTDLYIVAVAGALVTPHDPGRKIARWLIGNVTGSDDAQDWGALVKSVLSGDSGCLRRFAVAFVRALDTSSLRPAVLKLLEQTEPDAVRLIFRHAFDLGDGRESTPDLYNFLRIVARVPPVARIAVQEITQRLVSSAPDDAFELLMGRPMSYYVNDRND